MKQDTKRLILLIIIYSLGVITGWAVSTTKW